MNAGPGPFIQTIGPAGTFMRFRASSKAVAWVEQDVVEWMAKAGAR